MSSEKNITIRIRLSLNIFKSFFDLINTDIKKNRAINITALIMSLKIPGKVYVTGKMKQSE